MNYDGDFGKLMYPETTELTPGYSHTTVKNDGCLYSFVVLEDSFTEQKFNLGKPEVEALVRRYLEVYPDEFNALPRKSGKPKKYSKKDVKRLVKLSEILRDWANANVFLAEFRKMYPDLCDGKSALAICTSIVAQANEALEPFSKVSR